MADPAPPYHFARPLTVCVDFKNPHAYLGVAPTRALEARLRLDADWLPLMLPPLAPPRPARADDDRGTRHRRIRAEYFAADLERYAASRGLTLGNIYRTPDCTAAALGLLWTRQAAAERVGRYVEAVFERLWVQDGDIEGVAVVDGILADMHIPKSGFVTWAHRSGPEQLALLQAALQSAGLFNVPAYVVGDDVFYGRQHLPMVEWLLNGRVGEVPM